MVRRLAWSLLLGAALIVFTAGQAGAAAWTPAKPLGTAAPTQTSAGFHDSGATVGYLEVLSTSPPLATRATILELARDGSIAPSLVLDSTPSMLPMAVAVATAPSGAAAACITFVDGPTLGSSPYGYRLLYRGSAAAGWESSTALSPTAPGNTEPSCSVAIAPNGSAVAVAMVIDSGAGTASEVASRYVTGRTASGAWSAAQRVNGAGQDTSAASAAIDDSGTATIAWRREASGFSSIRTRDLNVSNGVLGSAIAVTTESAGNAVSAPRLATNGSGRQAMAFQYGLHTHVVSRTGGGGWDAPHPLTTAANATSSAPHAVAVSQAGFSYVLLRRQGTPSTANSSVLLARRASFNSWGTARLIGPLNNDSPAGALVLSGEVLFAIYSGAIGSGGGNPGIGLLQSVRWPSFLPDPEPAVDLDSQGPPVTLGAAGDDRNGSVVALASRSEGPLSSYAYDGGAPLLSEAAVPATVNVGETVQLRSTFKDMWSAVGQTTWDFGDGTAPGAGATVTHAWAAPGPYTVTITGRDAADNVATVTRTVTAVVPTLAPPAPPVDTVAPAIVLVQPACKKGLKKAACTALRKKVGSWRTIRGTVTDAVGVAGVRVTAVRKRRGKTKAKTVVAGATLAGGAWSARLKGLSAGTWTFTATATDQAGNARSAKRTVTLR